MPMRYFSGSEILIRFPNLVENSVITAFSAGIARSAGVFAVSACCSASWPPLLLSSAVGGSLSHTLKLSDSRVLGALKGGSYQRSARQLMLYCRRNASTRQSNYRRYTTDIRMRKQLWVDPAQAEHSQKCHIIAAICALCATRIIVSITNLKQRIRQIRKKEGICFLRVYIELQIRNKKLQLAGK